MFEAIGFLIIAWIGYNVIRSLISRIRNGPTAQSDAGNGDSGDSSWSDSSSDSEADDGGGDDDGGDGD